MRFQRDALSKTAVVIVLALLVGSGLYILFIGQGEKAYETGRASLKDLLSSSSTRTGLRYNLTIASADHPFYALIATPLAISYTGTEATVCPLLVAGDHPVMPGDEASKPVTRFIAAYGGANAVSIGPKADIRAPVEYAYTFDAGSPSEISFQVASTFWSQTDGAILVEPTLAGYTTGLVAAPLASYLDIPILFTNGIGAREASFLEGLGIKYTIVCGKIGGYAKTLRFSGEKDVDALIDLVASFLKDPEGLAMDPVRYIVAANPMDINEREVVEERVVLDTVGQIEGSDSAAYPGAAPAADGPCHEFELPPGEDWRYTNLHVEAWMDVSEANPDIFGDRFYCFIGVDGNGDGVLDESEVTPEDRLQFFGGSPGHYFIRENPSDPSSKPLRAYFETDLPFYNDPGVHHIQILAKLPSEQMPGKSGTAGDHKAGYGVTLTAQRLKGPTYPLMPHASSLAPYLAAYRRGVVMAKPSYQIHDAGYIGCADCGEPASNKEALDDANEQCKVVRKDLLALLGSLLGQTDEAALLAQMRKMLDQGKPMYLGIVGDTNMIPQYYYSSTGQGSETEGFGIPSDNVYADLDMDWMNAPLNVEGGDPSYELAVGRIGGWDAQDISALIARTVFYEQIASKARTQPQRTGLISGWKDTAMTTIGTEPPVGVAKTASEKLVWMFKQAGFTTDEDAVTPEDNPFEYDIINLDREQSRRQFSEPFYESSNFIYFCVHGFYYWYVPSAWEGALGILPETGAGGAYDVAHVRDMEFGPSVIFGSSCVTGRIDGLQPYNCISQAFLHSGVNAYVGATRSSWGTLVPIPDASSGEVLGDFLALQMYAHLTGYLYDKEGHMVSGIEPADCSMGAALYLAKNTYAERFGSDGGGTNDDTLEEFILHGDPAFNPYEPNHGFTSEW